MKKKIITFFAILLLFSNLNIAAKDNTKIVISSVSAQRDSTALVDVKIENNTGLAAITVSFTYDSSVLEYTGYKEGLLTDYSLKAYPSDNIIRFVSLEEADISKDGVLLSLRFKISANAEIKKYPITIEYSAGDFSNQNAQALSPQILSGGVEVVDELTPNEESSSQAVSSSTLESSAANSSSSASVSTSSQESASSLQSSALAPDSSSSVSTAAGSEVQTSSETYVSSENSTEASESNSNSDSLKETDKGGEKQSFSINPMLLIPVILITLAFLFIIIFKLKK